MVRRYRPGYHHEEGWVIIDTYDKKIVLKAKSRIKAVDICWALNDEAQRVKEANERWQQ